MLITVALARLCRVQELGRAVAMELVRIWRLVCSIVALVMLRLAPGCCLVAAMAHALI